MMLLKYDLGRITRSTPQFRSDQDLDPLPPDHEQHIFHVPEMRAVTTEP